jgi:hypothetical protein
MGVTSASDQTILAVDIEGFGNHDRTDPHQVEMRDGVHGTVRTALTRSGVPWDRCYHEDRGDGLFVLIPRDVPKKLLGAPVPHELAAAIREYNSTCREQARIRLRAAVHAGQVRHDAHGVSGTAVNLTFRLLNAPGLRSALAHSTGVLAMISSEWFYDDVIRHDPASTPDTYRRIRVAVKKTRTHAWLCRPDNPYRAIRPRQRSRRRAAVAIAGVAAVLAAAGCLSLLRHPQPPGDPISSPTATASITTTTTTAPGSAVSPPDDHPPNSGASSSDHPPGDGTAPPGDPSGAGTTTTTITRTVPTTSTTSTPGKSTSPNPAPQDSWPVQEESTVRLRASNDVDINWWRHANDGTGDLFMDPTGISAVKGAHLAVVHDSPDANRDSCQQVTTWTTRVEFSALHVDSQLCARSWQGRYAVIQVHALPNSPGSNGNFVFFGRTWTLDN